ncbi:MAG TPA: PD-(D/E)XK nuclease family protein [Tepidisphaeraceae bacterium]|nr:PD-(D/E)XK nuclease family protein [Tepidisphaeraceae bacterium]
MPVRFVIGRAGSGKTRHVFRSMVDAMRADPLGTPIYLILPKQATFSAERKLTCNSGLSGFCRAHVLSFDELSRTVLAECGGGAIPEVTPMGRQMLLGHLLRQHAAQLTFYDGAAHQPGLAARLGATFDEFQRSGKDPAALNVLIDELKTTATDAEGELLLRKMQDFRLLYTKYTAFLGQERLDPHGRLAQMLQCLHDSSAFRGATIFVDGFAEFTESERRTLARLARFAQRVEIALLVEPAHATIRDVHHLPDAMDLFHQTLQTYRQLHFAFAEEGVAMMEPLVLREAERFEQKPLEYVERWLFSDRPKPLHGGVPVELIEAHDRRAEVDAVARRILALLAENVRLRQIAVLVRDLEPYHELIDASFREHAIPYFADRRRTAAHHPLLVFTRAALAIARGGWPHEQVIALLKSGLADVTPDEADEVENYVLLHRIRGNAWGDIRAWAYQRKQTRGGDQDLPELETVEAARVDRIRRQVVDRLNLFIDKLRSADTRSLRQTVLDLFQLYEAFGVRQCLVKWMDEAAEAGELEQRGEHEQVWSELVSLLDQMVDLLGDELVSIGDFIEILEAGLEQFDLALTPPTVDQVLVGQIDRTRCPSLNTAFLVGLHEGEFPRAVREDSILSDSERARLQQRRVDLEPDSERRLLNEQLLGYIGFTRASRRLVVTRATSDDDGKPLGPSAYWFRLRRLLPEARPLEIRHDAAPADTIGTPRQMVNALVHWARNGARDGDASSAMPWPALYQWLATRTCCDDGIGIMRYRAWKALGYANEASLSPEIAKKLFATPLHASVTRIESFATCPFKHYVQYGLKLRPREDADVTVMDLGNVYHSILERVIREVLKSRADWADLETSVTDAMIHDYAEEVGRSLRGELMMSSARNRYLLGHIEKTLNCVIASQRAAMRRGNFRPAVAELGFGIQGGALPPFALKTPAGRDVFLHGKIDRVDLVEGGAEFAVIDYKLTGRPLALDRVYHGISLQLLTYLLVLEAEGERVFGRKLTPSAAFYVKLLRSLDEVKHPDLALAPDDPAFDLKEKPRGIFDGDCIDHLDSDCQAGGASPVVQFYIKKDGTFGDVDRSDVAERDAFAALLAHVRRRVGELADEIIAGRVNIAPYRINKLTPCPQCDFRPVCRFDPGVNRYHTLHAMKRSEVFQRLAEGAS